MQIQNNTQYKHTTFKRINLTSTERQLGERLLDNLKFSTTGVERASTRNEMFDLFKQHLHNETLLKGDNTPWKIGQLSKNLYLKFFDMFEKTKFEPTNLDNFLEKLNNFSENI